ncbi:imidazoleglycerol-phosphate dehydratase HisB [Alicyclobacillus acidocaldarius]|uniref:Imidazoleglycerol-phosphate dehydratase n=1 Tax=Alicyclobacillus acidocaldarius subsp. acidocaldarius (strain ATCC 27009 / DSM 446 / BCRC 14685 / JCM 5260 / KCTC 1825 / NBRC 15652 / NCIMB 11725 / NRRL B-14509 / 104-IA) TaxID=521098 RepID=C8WUX7_ALIAD|nr:imidazoleglycerol-phosphate dehydratase HisB [Alicyclobacillus acidocaldarius]ACV57966.1 Imidazoleglycerol-phosphate dehydratase [Alicyclobacillus acidocaldarius subsp. acidocaldarius DSM 446]
MSSNMERPTFSAAIERETGETSVRLSLNLRGEGHALMDFPVPFLRHMLHLFTVHGSFDLTVSATGDVDVDDHHLVEDIGLCLGRAIREALGNKAGIRRYGERHVPMDEALARAVIDLSGRPAFVLHARFTDARIGTFPTELVHEFFKSVANEARMALHLAVLYGENNHHMAEALFKAFGQALREAVEVTGDGVRSSKGVLE